MVFFTCNRLLSGMKITNESEAFKVSSKVSHIDIIIIIIITIITLLTCQKGVAEGKSPLY